LWGSRRNRKDFPGVRAKEGFVPRFYLHMKSGAHLIKDEEGVDLPTPDHARAEALQSARELWADAIKAGRDLRADAFVIADEEGKQLIFVPVTEVLPKRPR
jgi:hypothetical protein